MIFLTGISGTARAGEDETGNCAQFDFSSFYRDKELKWVGLARVLRQDTPLFTEIKDKKNSAYLAFNQQAEVLAEKGEFLKIHTLRFQDQPETTGWVHKSDLLCRNQPVRSDSGLEKKFFIRTSTSPREENLQDPTVTVFQDPELKECMGGSGHCREGASRFHMYFVFDETKNGVLLADRFRLEDEDQLLGWVDKRNGFLWNNAFSLRPREDLRSPDGKGPGTVCAYEQLEDAVSQNKNACQPVEGGINWFKSPLRIPVLDLVDQDNKHVEPNLLSNPLGQKRFYKVALAQPGLVGRSLGDGKFAISGDLAAHIMPEIKTLSSKKNVDIFFLLDATASMENVIDAVRGTEDRLGVIQEIIHKLKKVQGFKDTQFRFGYRVFRDPYADKLIKNGIGDGVGEGVPLPETCQLSPKEMEQTYQEFENSIAKVSVTLDDKDDYQENLFGGIKQVLAKDIASCPDHLKLLFVIGDNGYKARNMVSGKNNTLKAIEKYTHPVDAEELARLLRGSNNSGDKSNNIISFFIQTPNRVNDAKHPESYNIAYKQFNTQMQSLLEKSLPADSHISDYLLQMDETSLLERIVGTVEKLSSSALIDEIILDIRGGAALNSVIERLRRERVDIPGVYWHILEKEACGELGDQCRHRVFDTTMIGYIEASDKVVEELWVTSSDLSSWIRILRGFEGYFELPEAQLRRALISAMILGLQQEIRRPPIDVSGETPAEYAQRRGGLPVRRHSPLLSYQVNALSAEHLMQNKDGHLVVVDRDNKPILDKNKQPILAVPACELRRLALWAIKSKEILEIVEKDMRPLFTASRYQSSLCPDATPNGRELINFTGAIERKPLGPETKGEEAAAYRFGHTVGGRRGYWIPQDYLP
ncbi:MAG: hypothetical protein H7832_12260 [Magnetococcus sp. DMHC-6]